MTLLYLSVIELIFGMNYILLCLKLFDFFVYLYIGFVTQKQQLKSREYSYSVPTLRNRAFFRPFF